MSGSYLYNPKHWRERAEETRTKAGQTYHDELRRKLLKIADEYDRLASLAEKMIAERA